MAVKFKMGVKSTTNSCNFKDLIKTGKFKILNLCKMAELYYFFRNALQNDLFVLYNTKIFNI
jgi:hypothetical protein